MKNLLANLMLEMIVVEKDRWTLHPRAKEGFTGALDTLFAEKELDAKAEIEALLGLAQMMERKQAFEVAEAILDLVAEDARCLAVLGLASANVRDGTKRFSNFAGQTKPMLAPVFGAKAPVGAVKASSFLQPGAQLDRNAVRAEAPRRVVRGTVTQHRAR